MNMLASFESGSLVTHMGRPARVLYWNGGEKVATLKYEDTEHEVLTCQPNELLTALKQGDLHFISTHSKNSRLTLTASEIAEMRRREAYVKALAEEEHSNSRPAFRRARKQVSKELGGDKKPNSDTTLWRYFKEWEADGNNMAEQILRLRDKASPETSQAEDVFRLFMEDSTGALETPLASAAELFANCRVWAKANDHGELNKSDRQMRRYLERFDPKKELIRRFGRSEARKHLTQVLSEHTTDFPLEQVQMDALRIAMGVLDDDGNYLGTVIVYNVLDVHTRALLGYALSIGEKPGETTGGVVRAIRMAVAPKDNPDEYPMYGGLGESFTDNGTAYTSERANVVMARTSTGVQRARAKGAPDKGHVESFNNTMRLNFFAKLPGYLGKKDPSKYSDRKLRDEARLTKRELEELIYDWVLLYHNSPHSGLLNMTPMQMWIESTENHPPKLPGPIEMIVNLRGTKETCTLQTSKGIQVRKQFFNSKELGDLYHQLRGNSRKHKNMKVVVYIDEEDASGITVVDPRTGDEFNVPNKRPIKSGTSFHELNVRMEATKAANLERSGSDGSRPRFNVKEALLKQRNKHRRKNSQETISEDKFMKKKWGDILLDGTSDVPPAFVTSASKRAQAMKQQETVVEHLDELAESVEPMNVFE